MDIREYIKNNILYLDGGMGTLLQKKGLKPGELPERWNLEHPDIIKGIHLDYFNAGSNVVNANTFGANILKFSQEELEDIVRAAIQNARQASCECNNNQQRWVALDIGPTGRMLAPLGDLDFEDAVNVFAQTVKLGEKYGADLIFIETMNDCYETKAAVLAAKENSSLPVFVSNAYGEDGKLMTGADAPAMVAMLEGLGADAIGVNCSLGPRQLAGVVEKYIEYSSVPVILKPNAGLPKVVNGETVYDVSAEDFARDVTELIEKGVSVAGGCCGTTPLYINALVNGSRDISPKKAENKNITMVSSYTHAVVFGKSPVLIGERINPTGKKRFREALLANDIDYILNEGIAQQEKGVDILDVNVGIPAIDEEKMLCSATGELQAVLDLPLQIDTSDAKAMESALRRYNGKAMINSVNGKEESMHSVFPIAKKYGGLIVALTLDENGIPETAEGRFEIAKKILDCAEKYGIDKKDLIFDPLAMTVSADKNAAIETLRSVNMIKKLLGCHTSLGVSNVSFGLPQRDIINGTFFTLALNNGLSAAIMNPYSLEMMKAYYAFRALNAIDENCSEYIDFASQLPSAQTVAAVTEKQTETGKYASELQRAVIKGLKDDAASITKELIKTTPALDIIRNDIVPALDTVGEKFEKKQVYLPQLLMSAEAAKSAFEIIKGSLDGNNGSDKFTVVLATVKGDIHDIGKNIVKLLLENYGYNVVDLGRDVDPQTVLDAVMLHNAPVAGLSALMTTTVGAMEDTVRLLKEKAPFCRVVVGGAVLNKEYASSIGADRYAKDAMETVRYAESL